MKFTGDMLEAFLILTSAMEKKGDAKLLTYGKFNQNYKEGAEELKTTIDLQATEYNTTLAAQLNKDLADTAKADTPANIKPAMKEMVEICGNYLAQHAEHNKDKGPAFRFLIKAMQGKPKQSLYTKGKASRTMGTAATELDKAKGLESDRDDPNLSQEIHSALSALVKDTTPAELKNDMTETLDICSKYLSQCAIDEIERGPAFDILIRELEKAGDNPFTPEYKVISNNFAAGYTLKSAPGLSGAVPDDKTSPRFKQRLNEIVAAATPQHLKSDMQGVIDRSGNYLSAFVRDRDKAMQIILKQLKASPNKELVKRANQTLGYGPAAAEVEAAPTLVPFLPVKDISTDVKEVLTKETKNVTPPNLILAVKSAVQDVAKHLSQGVAVKSGVAGERYKLNFLAAIKKSLGKKQLFKLKAYGQTYADGAEVLQYAGPLESDPKAEDLHYKIKVEMDRGVPERIAPTVQTGLNETMNDASKHLAKVGQEKGEALSYVVDLMKGKGDEHLANMQGYDQSYGDGARRVENTPTLTNDKVEKNAYENVKEKLTDLTTQNPNAQHAKHIPGIVDDASKFLAKPMPETDAEKRQVLGDLMARKGDTQLEQEGIYKMTYKEGGEEIKNAPVGVSTAKDEARKKDVRENIHTVVPDEKMKTLLKGPIEEGAAHLSDKVKGRGAAMQVIHDDLEAEKKTDFLTVGKFKKDHEQTADMLSAAPFFSGQDPSPVLKDKVQERIKHLPKTGASDLAKAHMADTTDIASSYIAGVATKQSGLSPKDLADMDAAERAGLLQAASSPANPPSSPIQIKTPSPPPKKTLISDEDRQRPKREPKDDQQDRLVSQKILHEQLQTKGEEALHRQTSVELTHRKASEWLVKPVVRIDKSVKDSPDTARLHKKFERRLSVLVERQTPKEMADTMQDVVIESSRILSEKFVAESYQNQVRNALISEMQKRGNEILTEVDGAAETYFFAAQRLKKNVASQTPPCSQLAYAIQKKLDDMVRCRTMARKLIGTMKDYVKEAADYLSTQVTKPDEEIEAYVALLGEMEAAGDSLLIDGEIPKSHKDAAAYLRTLTFEEDQIRKTDSALQSSTEQKLTQIMANVSASGYSKPVLDKIIKSSTVLLVSYIKLQEEMTAALKLLVEKMGLGGDNILLRHGNIRKSFAEGAALLSGKKAYELEVTNVDPVVERKIQIKLINLMDGRVPENMTDLMDDVIRDATMYLAVYFLEPQVIKVCKCMKNVFVQCELWCDEILRRVSRPCCSCTRHVSGAALSDLTGERLQISHRSSKAYAPGIEISIKPCPSSGRNSTTPCPAMQPTEKCGTAAYFMHATLQREQTTSISPTKLPRRYSEGSESYSTSVSPVRPVYQSEVGKEFLTRSLDHKLSSDTFYTPISTELSLDRASSARKPTDAPFYQEATTMFAQLEDRHHSTQRSDKGRVSGSSCSPLRSPIVRTDQMGDWHSMMVSLMWNVQSWRDWIQENINRGRGVESESEFNANSAVGQEGSWASFEKKVAEEAMQWRQYNTFSQQLTLRLAMRYKNKQIVSPSRATIKTQMYMDCQQEMLDIIDMFNRWTLWLYAVVKETGSLEVTEEETSVDYLRWCYFKNKVKEYEEDWTKYNMHLKVCWEHKYRSLIADWLPAWKHPGPVWVVSAYGAVPSGAVAAGLYQGEVAWVARTTHKCKVLPAALLPSKHCCLVYADQNVHHYTKYQVMCNADVKWLAWRSGNVGIRAVRVAPGVHVGRVLYRGSHLLGSVHAPHYRCHVVIFGRPFAFNCYELLVLSGAE